MFTAQNRDELEDLGYTIIENAVQDHRLYKQAYFDWMHSHFGKDKAPCSSHSIVHHYGVGHLEPTWSVRLRAKEQFAALWGTDQLLTSVDAVAIGQPPEMGVEEFYTEGHHWLHLDQCAARIGLHAYQGAVYLEDADEDDWTFEVLEGSHNHISDFYASNPKARMRSVGNGTWGIRDNDLQWYLERGCSRKRIPVTAGGLLLWDSRLVHANALPKRGRTHPNRWRLVVLVCMVPAAWSTAKDIKKKQAAYHKMQMTTHWPADDVHLMADYFPSYATKPLKMFTSLSKIAQTIEAKRLAGVEPYPILSQAKVAAWRPKWDPELRPDMAQKTQKPFHPRQKHSMPLVLSLSFLVIAAIIVLVKNLFYV